MSPQLQKLFAEASQLSAKERVDLANQLFESVEDDELGEDPNDQLQGDAGWTEEIRTRITELETGTVDAIPWEQVRQKLLDEAQRDDAQDADAD